MRKELLGQVWDYAMAHIKRESAADLLKTAYYSHGNQLLKKANEEKLIDEIHEILRAKIPDTLPCEDNAAGIPLSTPSLQDGIL